MNCSDFQRTVSLVAGDRLIEAGARLAALRHAEACAACTAHLNEERALISGMRTVRAEIASEQAPVHLETVLLKAFREHAKRAEIIPIAHERPAAVSLGGRGRPRSQRSGAHWRVAAIAASILVLTSIGAAVFVRSILPREITIASIAPVPVPAEQAPPLRTQEPSDRIAQVPTPRHVTRHRTKRAETVTEYFPLITGDAVELDEFAQVVRIELSASALRDVGLPSTTAAAGDAVKADVVLGHDGIARAIRFVR
jgi:hypothetical protein